MSRGQPPPGEAIERRVLAALEALGVPYEPVRIDPALADTAAFCARYGYTLEESANCIVVATRTGQRRHAACLVQAARQLDVNRTVRKLLGTRKVSFAPQDEAETVTGMTTGGVTPFGLPAEMPVYVDAPILSLPRIVLGGGSRSLKLVVAPEAVLGLEAAVVVEGLSRSV